MQSVYEAAGGSEGLLHLAEAWHSRVMADEIVSHAFSHGFHPQHDERLAAYGAEALGGPTTYSDNYGDETAVVRIHTGNGPPEEMDSRAIACFDQALQDVGPATHEQLRQVLHDYVAWATTTTMSRRIRRRRPRRPEHSAMVMGRAAGLTVLPLPSWRCAAGRALRIVWSCSPVNPHFAAIVGCDGSDQGTVDRCACTPGPVLPRWPGRR